MKENGGKKVALVGSNQANSARVILQTEDGIKRTKGLRRCIKTVDVPLGSTEFGAIAQQIKDSGADALYTGMDTAANLALATALKQASANIKVMVFPGGYSPQIVAAPAIQDANFGIEFVPFESTPPTAGYTEFNKWLPPNVVRSQVTAIGWLIGDLMVEGIKAAGVNCPTRDGFITNLRLEKDYSANGFFTPRDFISAWNQPFPCAFFVKVVNNAFVPQNGGKEVCAKQVIRNNKISKELSNLTATTVAGATTTTTVASSDPPTSWKPLGVADEAVILRHGLVGWQGHAATPAPSSSTSTSAARAPRRPSSWLGRRGRCPRLRNGVFLSGPGSLGRPSTRSPTMFFWISSLPP